jgi:hypothetical protein
MKTGWQHVRGLNHHEIPCSAWLPENGGIHVFLSYLLNLRGKRLRGLVDSMYDVDESVKRNKLLESLVITIIFQNG